MPRQLSVDCIYEIFEYLEDDKVTLHSCLLVDRLYCEIAVRILWRNVWNFQCNLRFKSHMSLSIIGTLIACLPKESKDLLHKNEILFTTIQKPPLLIMHHFVKLSRFIKLKRWLNIFLKNEN